MIKRFSELITCLCLLISLTACGGSNATDDTTGQNNAGNVDDIKNPVAHAEWDKSSWDKVNWQ